ncbi:MAG TPA: hypothetical protein VFJ79_06285 [Acidimicrobiales bacterium]|nr:hypothetical protein [Acidimicrobiales bacterium]
MQVSADRAPEAALQGAASVDQPEVEAGSAERHRAVRAEAREVAPGAVVQVAAVGPSATAVARVVAGRPAGAGATSRSSKLRRSPTTPRRTRLSPKVR